MKNQTALLTALLLVVCISAIGSTISNLVIDQQEEVSLSDTTEVTLSQLEEYCYEGLENNYRLVFENLLVTYQGANHTYISDGEHAMLLFGQSGLITGDRISGDITGISGLYYGTPEFKIEQADVNVRVLSSGNEIPRTIVSASELSSNTKKYMNQYVRIYDVHFSESYTTNDYFRTLPFFVEEGTFELFNLYNRRWNISSEKAYCIDGVVSLYNSTIQVAPLRIKDLRAMRVDNIVGLVDVQAGDSIRLSLNDAQILFNQSGYTYVQDESGVALFYSMDIPGDAGQIMNGYIDGTYHLYNQTQYELITNAATDLSTIQLSDGGAVIPEDRTIEEALDGSLFNHLVTLKGLTIRIDGNRYYGQKDGKEIQIFNKFDFDLKVSEGSTANVTGMIVPYGNIIEIYPTRNVVDTSAEEDTLSHDTQDIIQFADAKVKAICVKNWDSDGDGELSEDEAAAVKDLGTVFKENEEITSFDELHYFTGLTRIGEEAFQDCSGLTSITIPNSVTSIGNLAFNGCRSLTSVTSYITTPFVNEIVFANINDSCVLYVPYGTKALYEQTDGWHEKFSQIIEMGKAIGTFVMNDMAFMVTSQTTKKTVTYVQGPSVEYLIIPSSVSYAEQSFSVTAIADSAFASLPQLKSVKIPSSVKAAGKNLFVGSPHVAAIIWEAPIKMTQEMAGSVANNPNLLFYTSNMAYALDGVTNVINLQTKQAEHIVLSDGEGNDFYCPEEFTASSISYTHDYQLFTVTGKCQGWESLVLPFDATEIIHEKNGIITPFGVLQIGRELENGTKPFWLYEYTKRGAFAEAEGIEANVPYILSMPNEERLLDEYILAGKVTFKGMNATVKASSNTTSVKSGIYNFTPNYQNGTSETVYLLNVDESYDGNPKGSVFVKSDLIGRQTRPFEAYFHLDGSAGVKSYFSVFDGLTDGIRSMEPAKRNSDAEYYQLDGTKRTSPQRGFNIIRTKDGKTQKVLVP